MKTKNVSRREFVKKTAVGAAAIGLSGMSGTQKENMEGKMPKEKVIRLLNEDITGEIDAILTYMRNAFVSQDILTTHEMEEIGKDEMRHVEWLSELVTDFGGIPTMVHHPLSFGGKTEKDFLKRAVELEQGAVAQYKDHIKKIDHPKVIEVLKVILWEEENHLEEFKEILEGMS
jgi:bacterioferritin